MKALLRRILAAPAFLRTYGQHLPHAFRAVFYPWCSLELVHGRLKGGGEAVTLLYAGRGRNRNWLFRSVFDEWRIMETWRANLVTCRRAIEGRADRADVVLNDVGWPWHKAVAGKRAHAEIPDWLDMAVSLDGDWDEVVARFRRSARRHDLRRIRRSGYRAEVVAGAAAAERFYDEMYLPFVRHRFPGEAALAPRRHVLRRAGQGFLLRVKSGEDIVAEGVLYPEGEVLFSLWLGMPREQLAQPPEAAIAALYFFGLRHAHETGYRWFDLGGTRAFLKDGPYGFKRRWGAILDDEFSPSSILIRPAANRRAVAFCRHVPVMKRSAAGLEAVFVRLDESVDESLFDELEKHYGCRGMDRITIIRVSEQAGCDGEFLSRKPPRGDAGAPPACERRRVDCGLEDFVDCYVA